MADLPWTVTDVTASIDADGEAERQRRAEEKATKMAKGVAMLLDEIDSRSATGKPPIQKTAAEKFLMDAKYTRIDARTIIADGCFVAVSGVGRGNPVELHRHGKDVTAKMRECSNPSENADFPQANFRRPHLEHAAEIDPSQTRMNTGDFQSPISAADIPLADGMPPAAEPGNASDEELFLDVEV